MITKQSETIKNSPQKKICPECGQMLNDHIESYLMECDRCLSKKPE
jgi:ribosomal protein S27AE